MHAPRDVRLYERMTLPIETIPDTKKNSQTRACAQGLRGPDVAKTADGRADGVRRSIHTDFEWTRLKAVILDAQRVAGAFMGRT